MEQFFSKTATVTPFLSRYSFYLPKPMKCPHCDFGTDSPLKESKVFKITEGMYYGVGLYSCTHCFKLYLVVYLINTKDQKAEFLGIYPNTPNSFQNTLIEDISPRFVAIYNQSLAAVEAGSYDLAIMGYRNALEALVKDYATKYHPEDAERIKEISLFKAIGAYLSEELKNTADVVRILGNDATHYYNGHEDLSFETVQEYMNYFIALMEMHIKSRNPPVAR